MAFMLLLACNPHRESDVAHNPYKESGELAQKIYHSTFRYDSVGLIRLDTIITPKEGWDKLYKFCCGCESEFISQLIKDEKYQTNYSDVGKHETRWVFTKNNELIHQIRFSHECPNKEMSLGIYDDDKHNDYYKIWYNRELQLQHPYFFIHSDLFFVVNGYSSSGKCVGVYTNLVPFDYEMQRGDSSAVLRKLSKSRIDSLRVLYNSLK